MSTAPAWTRGEPSLAGRVGVSAVLGVAVGATGVLRAADDLPMGVALVTMGAATLVQALMPLADLARRRARRVA